MKKLLLFFLIISSLKSFGQITNEGKPYSWNLKEKSTFKEVILPTIDIKKLKKEDAKNDIDKTRPFRVGVPITVDLNLEESGFWTTLDNGNRIWRILLSSKDAVHLSIVFDNFYIPKGASVYLYSDDRTELLGAYTSVDNNEANTLGTWFVNGDKVWVEYYEPKKVKGQGKLHISSVVHGYRLGEVYQKGYYDELEKALNSSEDCNQDVDCPIGIDFELYKDHLKHSVAFLNMGDGYICTGALVNNTAQDQTPYFLTANHCYERKDDQGDPLPPAVPSQFSMRFNWISPNPVCATTANSTDGPTNFVMSGSVLRARNEKSDFMLLELNNDVPTSWDITFAGWDHSDTPPIFEVGIHHPSGDIMKVSRDDTGATYATDGAADFWLIDGLSGTGLGNGWEIGVTEGGSSGSPLFNQDGYIIGQLFGGLAVCEGTDDNGEIDLYGRFATSWDFGATASTRLKDWLDPSNTSQITLGPYPAMTVYALDASVSSSIPEVACGSHEVSPSIIVSNQGTETLTSLSIQWNIDGGTNTIINWTGSLDQYQTEVIDLTAVTVSSGEHTFNVAASNPNGSADENSNNNTSSTLFSLSEEYLTTQIHLTLTTDDWAEETSWEFRNASNAVLYSGAYSADTDDNTTFTESFDVTLGECYTFEIFDSEGDGICCDYGNGSYSLTTDDSSVIISSGNFGASEATTIFINDAMGIEEDYLTKHILLFPNPSDTGIVNVHMTGFLENISYQVFNVLGQQLLPETPLENNSVIDLSVKQNGLYFIRITNQENQATIVKKIAISK